MFRLQILTGENFSEKMSKLPENSELINQQYRPRAPLLPDGNVDDVNTDDFCMYKVHCSLMKVQKVQKVCGDRMQRLFKIGMH